MSKVQKWLLVLLCTIFVLTSAWAADVKITQLPEDTAPTFDDLAIIVDSPEAAPVTKKATLANVAKAFGWIDSRAYTTLELANTAAVAAGKLLVIGQNYTLTANTVLTASILRLPGGSFTKASTYTLHFSGGFQNPDDGQCFIGFSSGDVMGLKEPRPEWWTINTTPGTTDMTTALQSAAANGGHIILSKNVMHTTTIALSVAGTKITGINRGVMVKSYGCNGFTITANSVEISNLTMNSYTVGGVANPWTHIGINASAAGYPDIYLYERIDNLIMGGWDKAIKFYAIWDSVITSVNSVVNREFVRLSELCARIQITNNLTNSSATGGIRADVYLEFIAAVGRRPEGILIQGNTFYGGDYGIYAPVGINGGLTITDNDISAGISAIKLATPNYTTIANNTSLLAQGANYVIDIPDQNSLVDNKNSITGNHIWNNSTGGGIYIGQYSQNWIVSNNIIDTSSFAIRIGPLSQDIIIDSNIGDINAVMQRIYLDVWVSNVSVTNNVNMRVSRTASENGAITVFNNTFDQKVTTRTIVPTTGTWNLGDRIFKNNTDPATTLLSSLGDILGWVCTSAGTFSTATDNTGDTTIYSEVITGLTDTSGFKIGDYVTISAGFPSATVPYMIIGKTATTLTFMFGAASTQANVTIATPDPVFSTFGQQGYRSGAATPAGAVTPYFIGEEYLDSTAGKWYKSTGLTNADWVALN